MPALTLARHFPVQNPYFFGGRDGEEKILLTDKAIAKLPLSDGAAYYVRDTELAGFMVIVGKRSKTFAVQGEFWRDGAREFSVRTKLGECGDIATREARSKAKEALGAIARGGWPGEEATIKRGSITLRRAWEHYRDNHMIRKGRDTRTIENYRDHMERLFEDWLDKPLARLGRKPNLVADRHNKISEENGRYIANGAMRSLRAVYNHARKTNLDLPPVNPVTAIDWNVEGGGTRVWALATWHRGSPNWRHSRIRSVVSFT